MRKRSERGKGSGIKRAQGGGARGCQVKEQMGEEGFVVKVVNGKGRSSRSRSGGRNLASSLGSGPLVGCELVQLSLERLDRPVRRLEILVQSVSLGDQLQRDNEIAGSVPSPPTQLPVPLLCTHVLLPLPEPGLLHLDLLGEPLPEHLLLLLEFRVVELLDLCLSKLAGLHLALPVGLVVRLLRRRDQVEHVRSDEQRPELAEVAVLLVVD